MAKQSEINAFLHAITDSCAVLGYTTAEKHNTAHAKLIINDSDGHHVGTVPYSGSHNFQDGVNKGQLISVFGQPDKWPEPLQIWAASYSWYDAPAPAKGKRSNQKPKGTRKKKQALPSIPKISTASHKPVQGTLASGLAAVFSGKTLRRPIMCRKPPAEIQVADIQAPDESPPQQQPIREDLDTYFARAAIELVRTYKQLCAEYKQNHQRYMLWLFQKQHKLLNAKSTLTIEGTVARIRSTKDHNSRSTECALQVADALIQNQLARRMRSHGFPLNPERMVEALQIYENRETGNDRVAARYLFRDIICRESDLPNTIPSTQATPILQARSRMLRRMTQALRGESPKV